MPNDQSTAPVALPAPVRDQLDVLASHGKEKLKEIVSEVKSSTEAVHAIRMGAAASEKEWNKACAEFNAAVRRLDGLVGVPPALVYLTKVSQTASKAGQTGAGQAIAYILWQRNEREKQLEGETGAKKKLKRLHAATDKQVDAVRVAGSPEMVAAWRAMVENAHDTAKEELRLLAEAANSADTSEQPAVSLQESAVLKALWRHYPAKRTVAQIADELLPSTQSIGDYLIALQEREIPLVTKPVQKSGRTLTSAGVALAEILPDDAGAAFFRKGHRAGNK